MNPLLMTILFPLAAGLLCFLFPERLKRISGLFAVLCTTALLVFSIRLFLNAPSGWSEGSFLYLKLDALSRIGLVFAALFGFLISLYALTGMSGESSLPTFYGSLLLSLGGSAGVLLSQHLLTLLVFWGFLGLPLYLFIHMGKGDTGQAATEALILIGGTDALMLLGIALLSLSSPALMLGNMRIPLSDWTTWVAFLCLCLAVFAKAGAIPVHTWIPSMARTAHVPATAFMPAALDKLVGIYLLARICFSLFELSGASRFFLCLVGSLTILIGVIMALFQHDYRRLLAFHAISQVGYMILGFGTGSAVGMAGALFHMLNNALYKSALFLSCGSVEYRLGTSDLDRMGGVGRSMPLTLGAFLVSAAAISGIPPLNGFASKWMIYQGVLDMGKQGGFVWIIWLVAALFGSGLTLASFMKLAHTLFLGAPSRSVETGRIREAGPAMTFPVLVLAVFCLALGILFYPVALRIFIGPAVPGLKISGLWQPVQASWLLFAGIILGAVLYLLGRVGRAREAEPFIGGEEGLDADERVTGTEFYNTIRDIQPFGFIFRMGETRLMDLYHFGGKLSFAFASLLQRVHHGVLTGYVAWLLAGLILLYILLGGRLL
ncbi:hypothetical protein JW906_06325 [bacterium]|nr:hypothetical protein [bacterium]